MMSLLAHFVPGWRPEDAATRGLAYILDPGASPGIAKAFVDLLSRGGVSPFQPGRVAHDASQADDSRPDLTLFDAEGISRVLVEVTFWGGVPDAQPAAYLEELSEGRLPDDTRPALVYVAPRDRIPGLWNELKARCRDSPGTDLVDESSRNGDAAWRNWGITPIWSRHGANEAFSGLEGGIGPAKALFEDAQETNGRLYVPVRLESGVERDRVIRGAVQRMRHIANELQKGFQADTAGSSVLSSPAPSP